MDIKSWILLVGTVLIVAVICHGVWTAYRARKNDVRMEIEADIPGADLDDLDEMVLLRGELPNGGARVTPTVGFEALRMKDRRVLGSDDALSDLPLDEVVALAEEGAFDPSAANQGVVPDEGNLDAGYEPEQTSLDLAVDELGGGLEERYAARVAAAQQSPEAPAVKLLNSTTGARTAPLLVDTAHTPLAGRSADSPSPLPRKKLIATEGQPVPRKQFEPPLPEEVAEQERAQEEAKVEKARVAQQNKQREQQAQAEAERIERVEREKRIRAEARKTVETPEQPQLAFTQDEPVRGNRSRGVREQKVEASTSGGEELVVLNVIAKTSAFQGGDVLELFLRNGIKFGDMNIFHRIDPVTKASQYSIASLTEPGYFDLRTMDAMRIKGLCLFMQLPGPGQPTKVFTDMLTVADKLARQLDAEVCDEQFNRLTRQSTEHYRQRVAEFSRRQMAQRALV